MTVPAFTDDDGSEFGASVSLSGDGTTLAIGSPEGCHPRSIVGMSRRRDSVRVYNSC